MAPPGGGEQPAHESGASKPTHKWRAAVTQVQEHSKQQQAAGSGSSGSCLVSSGTPSIIEQHTLCGAAASVAPRLAVMVGALRTGAKLEAPLYVKASLRRPGVLPTPDQQQKTPLTRQAAGGACTWGSLLRLAPHSLEGAELHIDVKTKQSFGRTVVWGSAVVPLQDVAQQPRKWGSKQQLALQGGKLGGASPGAVLDLQLYLSTERVSGPLAVLAATWNVGNAAPPAPEQLQEWLRGTNEGQHHLVSIAAQECNFQGEMRRIATAQRRASATMPRSAAGASNSSSSRGGAAAGGAAATAATNGSAPGTPAAADGDASPLAAAADLRAAEAAADDDAVVLNKRATRTGAAGLKSFIVDQVDSSAVWERQISAALGEQYWLVASKHMFQTRLLVFARGDVVPAVSAIDTGFEATGIGHIGVNKGGVAVGLKVDDTHLVFVSSHLAAHQGKTQQRNTDVYEICRNLHLPGSSAAAGSDLVTGSHHTVWMGDLNYRLEYGQQAVTQADSPTPKDFASLCAAIQRQEFASLLPLDQLTREMAAGRVFAGFRDGDVAFAPSFKVTKGAAGFSYAPKRSPAWCDRVLLKSVLPHKQGCHTDYFTCPGISTSDHKPVAAVLSLPLVTDTVTCRHQHHHRASGPPAGSRGGGAGGDAGAAALLIPGAPNLSISTARAGGTSSSSAKSSFAANWLGRSSRVAAAASSLPFKLFLSQVCLGDAATAQTLTRLVALNADALTNSSTSSQPGTSTPDPSDRIAGSSGLPASGSGRAWDKALNGLMHQGAADTPQQQQQQQQKQRRMKLQLVVSGSCLGGVKGEHVFKVDGEALRSGLSCSLDDPQPPLLAREESVHLLPGPVSQLTDDWLLLQLVLVDGWRGKRTLARAVLPLQPAAAEFKARSFRAVPLTLELELASGRVGSLTVTMQLISSAGVRLGMHEALRRMRMLAAATRSASLSATQSGTGGSSGAAAAAVAAAAGGGERASSSSSNGGAAGARGLLTAASAPPATIAQGAAAGSSTAAAAAAAAAVAAAAAADSAAGSALSPRSRVAEWLVSGVTPAAAVANQKRLSEASGC